MRVIAIYRNSKHSNIIVIKENKRNDLIGEVYSCYNDYKCGGKWYNKAIFYAKDGTNTESKVVEYFGGSTLWKRDDKC